MIEKISDFLITIFTKLFFINKVTGLQNIPENGPYIVVSNHASFFDHFLIHTILKVHKKHKVYFLTKKEAFDSYVSRKWHLAMGAIPLNRNAADTTAFRRVLKFLNNEKIICIYPEGTRSPTGRMYLGKQGAIWLAMTAQVPIIPIGIESSFDILPRKRFWPKLHRTNVNIGKEIRIQKTKDKSKLQDLHVKLMKEVLFLSNNRIENLYDLPLEKEGYINELLNAAYSWNERGIRNYPNDFLKPNTWHKRTIYICDEIFKMDSTLSEAYFEKARAIGRIGLNSNNLIYKIMKMNQARKLLLFSIKHDPNKGSNYYALAMWYMEMPKILGGNMQKALICYQKANSLGSEVYIRMGLAKALLKMGNIESAKENLIELIRILPAKTNVDCRRKLEALTLIMRIDPNFKPNDRMMNECLNISQNG